MIALVTGATGCIGHALARRLVDDPRFGEVRALVRPGRERDLPEGVHPFVGALEELPDGIGAGVDVVFHGAARVHDAAATPESFHKDNVALTGRLLDRLDADRPPRFVFFSTVAVYGEATPAAGLPESAPVRPATPYAQSKAAAEALVQQWADEVGAVAAMLRVTTVYGPRDRGNIARMIEAIDRGRFVLIDGGRARKSVVAVDTVAAAAIAVATAGSAHVADRRIVVAEPEPVTVAGLAAAIQQALGTTRRLIGVPGFVALAAARILGGRAPVTAAQVRRLQADTVFRPEALAGIPGYNPVIVRDEALRAAVAWQRQNPR